MRRQESIGRHSLSFSSPLSQRFLSSQKRHSVSIFEEENTSKCPDETLFDTLMNDPEKRAAVLKLLSQDRVKINAINQKDQNNLKKPQSPGTQSPLRNVKRKFFCESPTALLRRKALEKQTSVPSKITYRVATPSPLPFQRLLEGVVAYVEVKTKDGDRSAGAKALMRALGAVVRDTFTRDVTHVIFKGGSFSTYQKAKLMNVHLVSVLWLEAVRSNNACVPEKNYPALGTEAFHTSVSTFCQEMQKEYEDVIREELEDTLALEADNKDLHKSLRSSELESPSELTDSSSTSSKYHTPVEATEDVIDRSQTWDVQSVISTGSRHLPNKDKRRKVPNVPKTPDSIRLQSSPAESTSDSDSEIGLINGHSTKKLNKPIELDKITNNKSSSNSKRLENSLLKKIKNILSSGDANCQHDSGKLTSSHESNMIETVNCESESSGLNSEMNCNYNENKKRRRTLYNYISVQDNLDTVADKKSRRKTVNSCDAENAKKLTTNDQNLKRKSGTSNTRERISDKKSCGSTTSGLSSLDSPTINVIEKTSNKTKQKEVKQDTNLPKKIKRSISSDMERKNNGKDQELKCTNSTEISKQQTMNNSKCRQKEGPVTKTETIVTKKIGRRNSVNIQKNVSEFSANQYENPEGSSSDANDCSPSKKRKVKSHESVDRSSVTTQSVAIKHEKKENTYPVNKNFPNVILTPLLLTPNARARVERLKQRQHDLSNNSKLSVKSSKSPDKGESRIGSSLLDQKQLESKIAGGCLKDVTIKKSVAKVDLPRNDSSAGDQQSVSTPSRKSGRLLKKPHICDTADNVGNHTSPAVPIAVNISQDKSFKTPKKLTKPTDTKSAADLHVTRTKLTRTCNENQTINGDLVREICVKPPIRRLQSNKGAKKSSIVCTRFHNPEVQVFQQIVRKLGIFFVEDEVTSSTTHLVAGEPKRTVNILRALAMGCWILKAEWLYKSLETDDWLPEADYELTEFSPAVQHCRQQRQALGPSYSMDIFENSGPIYIAKSSTPRCSDLQELVTLCKGSLTTTPRNATIVVGEFVKYNVPCVVEKWVLDSITFNKRKSFKNYLIQAPNI